MSDESSAFASRSVAGHLARGAAALVLVVLAFEAVADASPLGTAAGLGLTVGALVLLRGCPMCWLAGLGATLQARSRGRADHR